MIYRRGGGHGGYHQGKFNSGNRNFNKRMRHDMDGDDEDGGERKRFRRY